MKSPFVDLLAQTEASLPTSDADITAFLAVHQTKFASGTTSAAAIKRQESAACVLWLQTLSPEDEGDVTTVESLPISLKKAIVTTFDLKQNPSTDGWSKLAIRRAHAHMAGGSSPVKKKRPEADGSDGRSAPSRSAKRRSDHHDRDSRSRSRRDGDRQRSKDRYPDPDRGRGRSRSREREHDRRRSRSGRDESKRHGRRSSRRDRSPTPASSSGHESMASDSDHSLPEARRGSTARPGKGPGSPARGARISKRSAGSGGRPPLGDSESDREARAPRRRKRSGYDSESDGGARENRQRPRHDRSSSPEQESRRRRKGRTVCRSESDSATSRDTDDSSGSDSSADSDRSMSPKPHGPKGRGVSFSSKGAGAPSSGRSASGSDRGSKRLPLLDLQASDSVEVLRLCSRDWLSGSRLQETLPSRWLVNLCRCISWSIKKKRNYEKARREARAGSGLRCEDPLEPAWVHRLSFLYTADASMSADAANLAHVAKGETLALYEIGHATAFVERQNYLAFLKELKSKWSDCLSSLRDGHSLSEVEKNGFNTWFLQGFERRFALMKRELGLATREAVEVVANSARQLSEIRTYVGSLWSDLANRASVLQRDEQAEFYRARFEVVFTPSVEVFLGTAGSRVGPGTFGPVPAGAASSADISGAAGSCKTSGLAQADGGMPAMSRPPRNKPPATVAAPPASILVASGLGSVQPPPMAGPNLAWPYQPPGLFAFGSGAAGPALPPPPYAPPPIKVEPSSSGGGRPTKQVHFSLPNATTGSPAAPAGGMGSSSQPAPSADGLDSFYPPGRAFVALPAHAYVAGPRAVKAFGGGPFHPACSCKRAGDHASTAHATWDCPLRYWSVRGKCPGFLPDGRRDPTAWAGDEITDATRAQWKEFASTLRKSRAASGVPSFD